MGTCEKIRAYLLRRYENILTFLDDFGISYHLYPVAWSTFDEDEQPSDKLADLVPRSYRSTVTEMQEPYNHLAMEKSGYETSSCYHF